MIKFNYQTKLATILLSAVCASTSYANNLTTSDEYKTYCNQSGGVVETMTAEISTSSGIVNGQSRMFCNFHVDNGFLAMGLETFASDVPSIAATFVKKMKEISADSPLWKGKNANPATNVCYNIGGSTIGLVANGGFANDLGQDDICVFGDGSMVAAWSLIYMANHRDGFEAIKHKVNALPLDIYIPH